MCKDHRAVSGHSSWHWGKTIQDTRFTFNYVHIVHISRPRNRLISSKPAPGQEGLRILQCQKMLNMSIFRFFQLKNEEAISALISSYKKEALKAARTNARIGLRTHQAQLEPPIINITKLIKTLQPPLIMFVPCQNPLFLKPSSPRTKCNWFYMYLFIMYDCLVFNIF